MPIQTSQPHLIPPMKLVLYDDIPNSPPIDSHPSIVSRCVTGGRTLKSKASTLTGLAIKHGFGKKVRKESISGPSNFRRTTLQQKAAERFEPLELSFTLPGNRLSDLPEFDHFDLNSADLLMEPPKALSTPKRIEDHQFFGPPSTSFTVPRKPVGLTSERSSVRSSYIEIHDRRKSNSDNRNSVVTETPVHHHPNHRRWNSQASNNYIGDMALVKESCFGGESPIAEEANTSEMTTPRSRGSEIPPHTPTYNDASIRSRLVAQWLSLKSPSTSSVGPKSPSYPAFHRRTSSGLNPRFSDRRSRALSGSTFTSLTNGSIFTHSKRTPSLSSTITATTYRPSNGFCGMLDKDCEMSIDGAISGQLPVHYETPCVTSHEKHQRGSLRSNTYHRDTAVCANDIGLAF